MPPFFLQNILPGQIVNGSLGYVRDFITLKEAEARKIPTATSGKRKTKKAEAGEIPDDGVDIGFCEEAGLLAEPDDNEVAATMHSNGEDDNNDHAEMPPNPPSSEEGLIQIPYKDVLPELDETLYPVVEIDNGGEFLFVPTIFPVEDSQGVPIGLRKQVSSSPGPRFPSCCFLLTLACMH